MRSEPRKKDEALSLVETAGIAYGGHVSNALPDVRPVASPFKGSDSGVGSSLTLADLLRTYGEHSPYHAPREHFTLCGPHLSLSLCVSRSGKLRAGIGAPQLCCPSASPQWTRAFLEVGLHAARCTRLQAAETAPSTAPPLHSSRRGSPRAHEARCFGASRGRTCSRQRSRKPD